MFWYLFFNVIHLIRPELGFNFTFEVNQREFLKKGLVVSERKAKILHSVGSLEVIKVSISYPFKSLKYDRYRFHELPLCMKTLKSFNETKIQNTIDTLFENGANLLSKRFLNVRSKRQALPILLGIGSSFIFRKISHIFEFRKHEIDTSHLADTIQKITCDIISARDKLFELKFEEKSRFLVENYFKILKLEIATVLKGSLRETNLQNIFYEYCEILNSHDFCEKLLEYSEQLIKVVDYGFHERKTFLLHAELKIPKLKAKKGVLFTIQPVFIPDFKTDLFLKPKVLSNILKVENNEEFFLENNCVGNSEKVFLCGQPSFFENILYSEFNLTYDQQTTKKMCYLNILNENIVFSNKIEATRTHFSNNSIFTKMIPPGIHISPKDNYIFTCENDNYKSFAPKFFSITKEINFMAEHTVLKEIIINDQLISIESSKFNWNFFILALFVCQFSSMIMISVFFYRKIIYKKMMIDQKIETLSIKTF